MHLLQRHGDVVRLTASNVFNNAVTFVTGFMIAASVSAESFGIYSIALNVVMIVFALSELGLGMSIVRFYNQHTGDDERAAVMQAGLSVKVFISTLLLLISFPLAWLLSQFLSPNHSITLELSLAIFCASALGLWSFVRITYQARQAYRPYANLTFRYGIVRLFLVLALFTMGAQNVLYYLLALYFAGPLVVAGLAFFAFARRLGLRFDRVIFAQTKTLLCYGKWVLIGSVLYPLCFSLPLFLIMSMEGPGAAGQYALGLMFVAIAIPFNEAMRAFILPKVSGFKTHQEAKNYIARIKHFALPYVLVLAVLVGVCVGVYDIFLSQKYPDGLLLIVLLMSASGLAIFGGIINSVAHYLGIPHLDAWINVARVVFIAVSSVIFIPHFSVAGAALSVVVAVVVGEIVAFNLIGKRLRSAQ